MDDEVRQKWLEAFPPLRDQFAMAALTGLCANPEFAHDDSTSAMTAELAFRLAHAMLAERDKVKP